MKEKKIKLKRTRRGGHRREKENKEMERKIFKYRGKGRTAKEKISRENIGERREETERKEKNRGIKGKNKIYSRRNQTATAEIND